MITKNEAYRWTVDKEDKYWLLASIRESVYDSIANQKFYCDWYSPARYDISNEEIEFINSYLSNLEDMGFVITPLVYDRTEDFPNQRMEVCISWE